jgi:hypothetical protein
MSCLLLKGWYWCAGSIVGHVGDGNFHSLLLYTTDDELAVIKSLASNLAA